MSWKWESRRCWGQSIRWPRWAAEALTAARRAGETDCADDSSPRRTGAAAAPRCKLLVTEGGSPEWREDRRHRATQTPESPPAPVIPTSWRFERARGHTHAVILRCRNQIWNRGDLMKLFYFSEGANIVFIISALYLLILDTGQTRSCSPGRVFLLFLWLMDPSGSGAGFPSQSQQFNFLFPAMWLRTRRSFRSHVYVFTSVRSHLHRSSPEPGCAWQLPRWSAVILSPGTTEKLLFMMMIVVLF